MATRQSDIIRKMAIRRLGPTVSSSLTSPTTLSVAKFDIGDEVADWNTGTDIGRNYTATLWNGQVVGGGKCPVIRSPGAQDVQIGSNLPQNSHFTAGNYNLVTTVVRKRSDESELGFNRNIRIEFYNRDFYSYHNRAASNYRQVLLSKIEFIATDTAVDQDHRTSPFDFIEYQDSRAAKKAIDDVLSIPRDDTQALHDRLTIMLETSMEEMGVRVLSPASIRFFTNFLKDYSDVSSPRLFQADSGALRAQWIVDSKRALTVLFQPSGIAEYVLFAPDRRRPSITVDHAGAASWQSVIPSLKKIANLDWLRKTQ